MNKSGPTVTVPRRSVGRRAAATPCSVRRAARHPSQPLPTPIRIRMRSEGCGEWMGRIMGGPEPAAQSGAGRGGRRRPPGRPAGYRGRRTASESPSLPPPPPPLLLPPPPHRNQGRAMRRCRAACTRVSGHPSHRSFKPNVIRVSDHPSQRPSESVAIRVSDRPSQRPTGPVAALQVWPAVHGTVRVRSSLESGYPSQAIRVRPSESAGSVPPPPPVPGPTGRGRGGHRPTGHAPGRAGPGRQRPCSAAIIVCGHHDRLVL
jgi:hypothetical protein